MALLAERALAWRLRQQALDPPVDGTVKEMVDRVLALRAWPSDAADLAVSVRQVTPNAGGLQPVVDGGELIRSYAFRGGSYVFTPEIAALVLSVRTVSRVWETRRWQQQGGFELDDWEPLRHEVCAALADGPMTREEISACLARTKLTHLAQAATGAGADSLYKPLHWWGDICFGPPRDGKQTFRLLRGDPRWPGLPAIDDAGPELVKRYLGAYGPATKSNLHYWLTEGLGVPYKRVQGWIESLGDETSQSGEDGEKQYALTCDLEELETAQPSETVRLLPCFDAWILGPGTSDERLLAPERRSLFSQGANPVIYRGVVSGTWRRRTGSVEVAWFDEIGGIPRAAIEADIRRLSPVLGDGLNLTLSAS